MNFLIRICLSIIAIGFTLFLCVEQQNRLTELRLQIPLLEKELRTIQKENQRLAYEIERFQSPIHLMELARKPEFGYLKHPLLSDVIILPYPKESISTEDYKGDQIR
jgi:cell division protein FtsB